MRIFLTTLLLTFLTCSTRSRQYHYNQPAVPFFDSRAAHAPQTPVPQSAPTHGGNDQQLSLVVRTLGSNPSNYELYDFKSSHQIFEGKMMPAFTSQINYNQVSANAAGTQQQYQQSPQYQHVPAFPTNPHAAFNAAPRAQNTASYQQSMAPAFSAPAYSTQTNPFTTHNNVQHATGLYQSQGAFTQGNIAPQPAFNLQSSTQHISGQPGFNSPSGTQHISGQPGFNSQSGTQHISGQPGFNSQSSAQQITGEIGNHISQSEAGQLSVYPYTQQGGDPRAYKRLITTCYPNGQCERVELGAGPTDPRQQNIIYSTRARTAPVADKCRRIAEAQRAVTAGGAATNFQSAAGAFAAPAAAVLNVPVRPPNRRLYPYSEVITQDSFN